MGILTGISEASRTFIRHLHAPVHRTLENKGIMLGTFEEKAANSYREHDIFTPATSIQHLPDELLQQIISEAIIVSPKPVSKLQEWSSAISFAWNGPAKALQAKALQAKALQNMALVSKRFHANSIGLNAPLPFRRISQSKRIAIAQEEIKRLNNIHTQCKQGKAKSLSVKDQETEKDLLRQEATSYRDKLIALEQQVVTAGAQSLAWKDLKIIEDFQRELQTPEEAANNYYAKLVAEAYGTQLPY